MHVRRFLFTLFAVVALSPPFLCAQVKASGTIPSTGGGGACVSINVDAQATVAIQITGSWTGTLQPEISVQGQAAANTQVTPSTSTTAASTITANGVYRSSVAGGSTFLVCGNTVASGTANIYLNATTASAGSGLGGGGGGGGGTSPGTIDLATSYNMSCSATFSGSPAKWTPVTTTTNGTVAAGASIPVANAATFAARQGVYIAGAGAAGANYIGTVSTVNGSTITVNPATSTSVTNATVQHEESAALNSAISDLNTGAIDGVLQMPAGVCLFNGPLQDTSNANAIINMPDIQYNFIGTGNATSGPSLAVHITGTTQPPENLPQLNGWIVAPSAEGTVIQTSATSGNLFGGKNVNGGLGTFTNVYLDLENITLRSYPNPSITMVNGQNLVGLSVRNIMCDTMSTGSQTVTTQPTNTNGQCILMPINNNMAYSLAYNVIVDGYYNGMIMGEHTTGDALMFANNWNGLAVTHGAHANQLGRVGLYENAYGLVAAENNSSVFIAALDTETSGSQPAWVTSATNTAIIYDPTDQLNGTVRINHALNFSQYGGHNLKIAFDEPTYVAAFGGRPWVRGMLTSSNGFAPTNWYGVCEGQVFTITARLAGGGSGLDGCITTAFNFTGQTVTVRVPVVLKSNATSFTGLFIGPNKDTQNVNIQVGNGTLFFQKLDGSATNIASPTYNPVAMQWWRLSESAGTITASYSADGVNWTSLGSTTVTWAYTSTNLSVGVVTTANGTGYAQFDSFSINSTGQATPANHYITDGLFASSQTGSASACETSFGATTLATGATTTNTGLNCLPINAVIDAVVYRITTTITTAATFQIGDATTSGRFSGALSGTPCGGAGLTAGSTGICFVQADQTGASGPRQTAAAAVRVTTNVNPGAGAIRLIVYYHSWTAPTS